MKKTLLALALVACGGADAQPVAANTPPAAAASTPSETRAATDAPPSSSAEPPADPVTPAVDAGAPADVGAGGDSVGVESNFASGSAPPLATLRQGPITISGRNSTAMIEGVATHNFPKFRECYEHGLEKNHALAGRVTVRFVIGPRGDVTSAADGGSDIASNEVRRCVLRAFKAFTFQRPSSGAVSGTYTVIFDKS